MDKKLLIDIERALKKYPSLKMGGSEKMPEITGIFSAFEGTNPNKIEIETYELKIHFHKEYPFRFPTVIETSNKIPRNGTRHVNNDNSLCFGNLPDEYRECKNGISFLQFLETILNPHLCREYFREKKGKYQNGERSHGNEGIWETYYEIFETTDKIRIIRELEFILENRNQKERNDLCYCNSNKKYKKCHMLIENNIFDIGIARFNEIFAILKDDLLLRVPSTSIKVL